MGSGKTRIGSAFRHHLQHSKPSGTDPPVPLPGNGVCHHGACADAIPTGKRHGPLTRGTGGSASQRRMPRRSPGGKTRYPHRGTDTDTQERSGCEENADPLKRHAHSRRSCHSDIFVSCVIPCRDGNGSERKLSHCPGDRWRVDRPGDGHRSHTEKTAKETPKRHWPKRVIQRTALTTGQAADDEKRTTRSALRRGIGSGEAPKRSVNTAEWSREETTGMCANISSPSGARSPRERRDGAPERGAPATGSGRPGVRRLPVQASQGSGMTTSGYCCANFAALKRRYPSSFNKRGCLA